MSIEKWVLLALFAFESVAIVTRVGRPRPPITPSQAAQQVATWISVAVLVIYA